VPAPIGPRGLSEAAEGATVRHPNRSKTPRGGAKNDNLPVTQGSLFTRDFPLEGVMEEQTWKALSAATLEGARVRLEALLAPLARQRAPNEAETEAHLVFPLIEQVLGWAHWLPQQNQSATGREGGEGCQRRLRRVPTRATRASRPRTILRTFGRTGVFSNGLMFGKLPQQGGLQGSLCRSTPKLREYRCPDQKPDFWRCSPGQVTMDNPRRPGEK
jgi:hypothetical protein